MLESELRKSGSHNVGFRFTASASSFNSFCPHAGEKWFKTKPGSRFVPLYTVREENTITLNTSREARVQLVLADSQAGDYLVGCAVFVM